MEFHSLDELARVNSCELGATSWRRITHEQVQAFADLTGDHQWIHLDRLRAAAESPFGANIAHGAFILSLVPVFAGELLSVSGSSHVINAGLDRARLRAPVLVGSNIRGRATLHETEPFASGLLAYIKIVVEIEGQKRPTCTAEQQMVFYA
jgi:acyl dehydratase